MKKLMAVIAVLAVMAQVGCSTTGGTASSNAAAGATQINPATLASFQVGVTTLDQVEAALGKPVKSIRAASGDYVILYARIRIENVGDRTPETGTALPRRHRMQHSTLLSFDPQGRFLASWIRTDDLGDASLTALGNLNPGDILTSAGGLP